MDCQRHGLSNHISDCNPLLHHYVSHHARSLRADQRCAPSRLRAGSAVLRVASLSAVFGLCSVPLAAAAAAVIALIPPDLEAAERQAAVRARAELLLRCGHAQGHSLPLLPSLSAAGRTSPASRLRSHPRNRSPRFTDAIGAAAVDSRSRRHGCSFVGRDCPALQHCCADCG